jgi:fatty-acyl-CoA synthase
MSAQHFRFWPDRSQRHLDLPATNVFYNAEVSARRRPDKPCIIYYDTRITFTPLGS